MSRTISRRSENKDIKELQLKDRVIQFVSSSFVATGQEEFYNTKSEQREAILSVHKPILENFRKFYCVLLLSNINDFNKQIIIYNLLKNSQGVDLEEKEIEKQIILQALIEMQPQRAYKTFVLLAKEKVNNARTRWLAINFLTSRKNVVFESVKYQSAMKLMVVHNHLFKKNSEVFKFLFDADNFNFTKELYKTYKEAKTDKNKVFQLPYSVAEGFAAKHKIDRKEFLKKISSKMTEGEKLRMQNASKKEGVKIDADWTKFNLVNLYKYLRTIDRIPAKAQSTIDTLVEKLASNIAYQFGKTAIVIDNSLSMSGSTEKKNHPIAIAQALSDVIAKKAKSCQEILVNGKKTKLLIPVEGSSNLSQAVMKALKTKPEYLIIISDGYENEPAGLLSQIIDTYKTKIDNTLKVFHINPVFAAETEQVRSFSESIPFVGLRDPGQLNTSIFLLEAHEDVSKAIESYQISLLENKKQIDTSKNYLIQ